MDTVVRRSDRRWFRVMEVGSKEAVLRETYYGEFGNTGKSREITVSLDKLASEFEKKDYPEVKCYVDPELKKKQEDVSMVKAEIQNRGRKVEPGEALQVDGPVKTGYDTQGFEDGGAYVVNRGYLQSVDQILDAVGLDRASDKMVIQARQLIAQIIHEGVLSEMGFEQDEIAAGADLRE